MNSLEQYIYWRGDLPFDVDPLNEVDGMILSELTYINFLAFSPKLPKTLGEAALLWKRANKDLCIKKDHIIRTQAFDLLIQCAKAPRFRSLELKNFVYELSYEDDSQFGALSFLYKDRYIFIAFQGTDLHVIGWKEDFRLSYLPAIPSQEKARAYLQSQLETIDYKVSIGGHSKGGNLAIYSLIFQSPRLQERVDRVYNYDGPGFAKSILSLDSYQKTLPKIYTYIPQDSLVGLLLSRLEEPIVVKSLCSNIKQHLGYYWHIEKNAFTRTKLSKEARRLAFVLDKTLEPLDENQRKHLTDAIFSLFGEDVADNVVLGTTSYNIRKFQTALLQLGRLPNASKKLLVDVALRFIRNRLDIHL